MVKAWKGTEYRRSAGKQVMRACDRQIMMPRACGGDPGQICTFSLPLPGDAGYYTHGQGCCPHQGDWEPEM